MSQPTANEQGLGIPQKQDLAHSDKKASIDSLLLAFAADPAFRAMYPTPEKYVAGFPVFTDAFGGAAFDHGTAHALPDFSAVALWFPPGEAPDDGPIEEAVEKTVILDPKPLEDTMAVLERMGEVHAAQPEKHWYLAFLGVESGKQGQGLGSILMKECLLTVDEQHMPAYLESSNPQNVPFYERHGFEILETIDIGTFPTVTPMFRPAR